MRAAADRRLAQAQAELIVSNAVTARGPMTLRDVYAEIAKTAGLAVAWRDLLESKVAALADWRYEAKGAGTEQLRSEVALFERALDRTGRLLEVIARLDIDTRAEKIATQEGHKISGAVKRAFAQVPGLDQGQRDAFDAAMSAEFRALIEPPGAW